MGRVGGAQPGRWLFPLGLLAILDIQHMLLMNPNQDLALHTHKFLFGNATEFNEGRVEIKKKQKRSDIRERVPQTPPYRSTLDGTSEKKKNNLGKANGKI